MLKNDEQGGGRNIHGILGRPKKRRPLVQFGYEFTDEAFSRLKPNKESLEELAREWVRTGDAPAGVKVDPIFWGEELTHLEIRERLAGWELHQVPGVVEHYADPQLILLDFDSPRLPRGIEREIWKLAQTVRARVEWIEYQRTRRGWHVATRWTRKFTPAEICWLQLRLGSDVKRETFNFLRVLAGGTENNKRWNLLFDYKL